VSEKPEPLKVIVAPIEPVVGDRETLAAAATLLGSRE
jgi:hypothetical protein